MIAVREATGRDVAAIRDVFLACYGTGYTDPRYYEEPLLTRLVHSDENLLLVAEEAETGRLAGTASVILEVGAPKPPLTWIVVRGLTGVRPRMAASTETASARVGTRTSTLACTSESWPSCRRKTKKCAP
jgi:hypothetical protein